MDNAFRYLEKYSLEGESSYPYEAKDASCRYSSSKGITKVGSYKDVSRTESAIKSAINKGPLSIAVDATCF